MTSTLRYVVRNLGRRRTRTVMGVLGIFLTIALLTTIQIGLDSVSLSYINLVSLSTGKADILITKGQGSIFGAGPFDPQPVFSSVKDNPHLLGLTGRVGHLVNVRAGGKTCYAFAIGIDPDKERELDINGLEPEPKLRPGMCCLSESLKQRLETRSKDKVEISGAASGGTKKLEVEAIIERQLVFPQEVRDYVVLNIRDAAALLNLGDKVHMLAGAFRDTQSYYDARDLHASVLNIKDAGESIAADLGNEYTVALPKAAAITLFQNITSPLRAIFGIFALLALTIAGLLIYSLVSVGVEERIREFGILRTLGAKGRYIFSLVLSESFVLCILGVVPGVLCGALLAGGILSIVELAMGAQGDPISLTVSGSTLWLSIAVGAALSVGSSVVPAVAAVRRSIIEALDPQRRGHITQRSREGETNRPLLLAGLALSVMSVIVFFVVPAAFLSLDPSLIGAVVLGLLMMTLLGFTLMAVGVLPWFERIVMALTGWAFGPSADLARRNLARHRRRNVTTSLMFALSVCFVLFIASLVALFSGVSISMIEQLNGADLRIRVHAQDRPGGEEVAAMAEIEGVEQIARCMQLRHRTKGGVAYEASISDIVGMKSLWIVPVGVDENLEKVIYAEHIKYEEGGPEALAKLAADDGTEQTSTPPPVILSQSAAGFLDVHAGDIVDMSFLFAGRVVRKRFRIEAVCSTVPGFRIFRSRVATAIGSGVMLSLPRFRAITGTIPPEALQQLYFLKAGHEQTEVAREIRERFGLRYRFGVSSTEEKKKQAETLYWTTQVFFGLLLMVAVLIAVFCLVASMATTVIERRWEIGVLKAIGLRRRQLFQIFLGEAVALTLSAGLAGGFIGFALAYLFVLQGAALAEVPMVFTLPYIPFVATFVVSVAAGAIAAFLPTKRVLRKSAAEILRLTD